MITLNDIITDAIYEDHGTDLEKEMFDIMNHFQDEHDINPVQFLKMVDIWLDQYKINKPKEIKAH